MTYPQSTTDFMFCIIRILITTTHTTHRFGLVYTTSLVLRETRTELTSTTYFCSFIEHLVFPQSKSATSGVITEFFREDFEITTKINFCVDHTSVTTFSESSFLWDNLNITQKYVRILKCLYIQCSIVS